MTDEITPEDREASARSLRIYRHLLAEEFGDEERAVLRFARLVADAPSRRPYEECLAFARQTRDHSKEMAFWEDLQARLGPDQTVRELDEETRRLEALLGLEEER